LSRIRIFTLFATLVALAIALAACGGGGDDSSSEDPHKVVETASLAGLKSGELELSLHVNSEGKHGGSAEVEVSGPFEAGAKGELPQLELEAKVNGSAQGNDLDFQGGLTLLTDRAFVEYEGTSYEVDPTTFGFVKSALEQAEQGEGGESGGVTACQKAVEGIKFSQFAENLRNEGSADVDGTSTTKVSGDLDVRGAIDALIKLTEDPACSSQLEAAGPLPLGHLEEAKGELSKAIKKSHVELYVGDDDIVRKAAVELTIQPPEAADEKVELALELSLAGVNEEQSFSEPSKTKPLQALFQKLGINPIELLEAGSGGGLSGLLEGITGGAASGGSPSGGSSEFGGGSSKQQEYAQCLGKAETTVAMQKCANLFK
jgi:hypothetical protein